MTGISFSKHTSCSIDFLRLPFSQKKKIWNKTCYVCYELHEKKIVVYLSKLITNRFSFINAFKGEKI